MVVGGNQVARIFLLYWKVCPRQLSLTSIKICSPRPPRIFANATASRIPRKMLTVVRIVLASMSKRPDCELAERTRDCLFERPCDYWINYTEPFYQESWILLPFKKEDIFSFEHRNGFYNASAKGGRNSSIVKVIQSFCPDYSFQSNTHSVFNINRHAELPLSTPIGKFWKRFIIIRRNQVDS